MRKYQICSNCIMDTSDSNITFDERGLVRLLQQLPPATSCRNWHPDERGEREIMRAGRADHGATGKGRDHDCLIGISGGVDSSYVDLPREGEVRSAAAAVPRRCRLELAAGRQQHRESSSTALGLDLHTEVVDWLEMKDLQLAFFKAQVPHLDTPQDHAFFAALYNFAAKHGFKYILTGANYSTECVREPLEWHYHASDLRQLQGHPSPLRHAAARRPSRWPTSSRTSCTTGIVKGVRVVKPLNYVPYIKEEAMQLLVDRFGWQRYAHKHYESRFTRFYEGYWLPTKFGYDKRRAHFSSLILTGQMTRDEALRAHCAAGLRRSDDRAGFRVRRDQARLERRRVAGADARARTRAIATTRTACR